MFSRPLLPVVRSTFMNIYIPKQSLSCSQGLDLYNFEKVEVNRERSMTMAPVRRTLTDVVQYIWLLPYRHAVVYLPLIIDM